jgi:uncharacterized membrane protein YphA (DoxX/SURF4 family)
MVQAAAVTTPDRRLARYRVLFATARIALGCYWLYEQHWKLPPDFGLHQPRGLMFAFEQSIRYPTFDLYRAFLQDVFVPHFHVFGWLLLFAEDAIGLSLVLGAFTRAGAVFGVLQALNLLTAPGRTPEGPWIYVAILMATLFVLLTPSNCKFSIDHRFAPKIAPRTSRETLLTRAWRLASGCPTL